MPGPGDEKDPTSKSPFDDQPTTPVGGVKPPSGGPPRTDSPLPALEHRYEILGEVGRGGMGIVYKARDRETGAVVALKVLRPEIAANTAVVERFKSELLLARRITHKNVCRIYDLHRFGETAAIAMEYVEGQSLRHIIARFSPLSVRKGLEWTTQICDALQEAHAQGVVHRDLKPENILIDRDGKVKVMDFGIARSIETTTTTTGVMVGTPAYMAPEQAEGKPVDARSDIYSLGLILYEMFTGRQAFRADTPVALALKQIHETPPTPRELEPALPANIEEAILKCLEKRPTERFPSVGELAAVLAGRSEPKIAAVEGDQGEVVLPDYLLRWQRTDIALFALAVASLGYLWHVYQGFSYYVGFDLPAALRHGQPAGISLFLLGVLLFVARRLYRYKVNRANAIVASTAGIATARLVQSSPILRSIILGGGESSYWLWLAGLTFLVVVASYSLLCSVTYYSTRAAPERIVSFLWFNRGFSHWAPGGIAILRGLEAGVALAGIYALSIWTATHREASRYLIAVPPWPGDLTGAGGMYHVGVDFVFLESLLGSCVLVGFPAALLQRAVRSKRGLILLVAALWPASHYALWGMMLDPAPVFYITAALQGALLTTLYLRYDLLTLFCAIFTAETWLVLYQPGEPPTPAFSFLDVSPFLLLLAFGIAAAFQRHIVTAYQRVRGVLE
jgi:predicted Ser/Thr protein kinase